MLKKIQRKAKFINDLLRLGAGWKSKAILMWAFLRFDHQRRNAPKNVGFPCRIKAQGRSTYVYFSGTMSELHMLVDIFVNDNYEPKHRHSKTLFSDDIRTMLDLGANIGLASIWFSLRYPNISIDAYEPNPAVFAILQKNLAQFPRARAFQKAIAPKEGVVEFNQSDFSLESSMFAARESKTIEVLATALDSAIELIGVKSI